MIRLLFAVLLTLSVTFVTGCSPATVTDYASLVNHLKKSEAAVEPKGNTEQPVEPELFSGQSKLIKLEDETTVVWEYPDKATAAAEARFVKYNGFDFSRPPDASSQGFGGHIDWIAPPHWYTAGRIIVLYVGKKQETLDLLENLLGPYYAGPGIGPPPVTDYISLIDNLLNSGAGWLVVKARGDAAFPGDDPQQRFFSGTGKRIELSGENISVLEYEDEATAQTEAKFISPDGSTYTAENWSMVADISWVAPPHFYQAGKIIVLYIGTNQAIIDLLENLIGPPFAGWGRGTD